MRRELRPALSAARSRAPSASSAPQPSPPRDQAGRRQVALGVAEGEPVVGGATLAEVHGQGHDRARGHRVQPELVAGAVEGGDRGQVADAAVGAAEAEGLELRPFADVVAEPVDLAAGEWALRAGADLGACLEELRGVDAVRALELARAPVPRRQRPGGVDEVDEERRALLVGPGVVRGEDAVVLQFEQISGERGGVADGDRAGAAHDHGLEVLAAHHGAGASAPGLVVLVRGEAGEGDELLAGRARGEDLVPRAHLLAHLLLEGRRLEAPEAALGRQEVHPVVLDQHEHRVRRPARHDHHVVARELELRRERAADVGVQQRSGRRALAAHGEARAGRRGGAGERAAGEDERVLGSERVGARRQLGEQVPEQEALAADVQPGPVFVERLDRRRQGGQVEPQHASGVEVHASPHCGAAPRTMVFQGGRCYNAPVNHPVN